MHVYLHVYFYIFGMSGDMKFGMSGDMIFGMSGDMILT